LVELSISLPLNIKIKNGWTKYILRKAIEEILPESIVWRKNKYGFEAPTKMWLSKYRHQMISEIQSSRLLNYYCEMNNIEQKYNRLSPNDQWFYFNIARWEKVYNIELDNYK